MALIKISVKVVLLTWDAFDLPESESGFEIMIPIRHFI